MTNNIGKRTEHEEGLLDLLMSVTKNKDGGLLE